MKINLLDKKEILAFEKEYGLELIINEKPNNEYKFYAFFEGSQVINNPVRKSEHWLDFVAGYGNTIDEALYSLARQLSCRTLIFSPNTKDERQIDNGGLVHTMLLRR